MLSRIGLAASLVMMMVVGTVQFPADGDEPGATITPSTTVFYPDDDEPGVAHVMRITLRWVAGEATEGDLYLRILASDGQPLGITTWAVDATTPGITWDGRYHAVNGTGLPAPGGTYRAELTRAGTGERVAVSTPFVLSRARRELVRRTVVTTAKESYRRTVTRREGRARLVGTSLRFRSWPTRPSGPVVKTLHSTRVPAHVKVGAVELQVRGAWDPPNVGLEVVKPNGRVVRVGIFSSYSNKRKGVHLRESWIRPNGTVRFRFVYTGYEPVRLRRVAVSYWRYEWKS
ncbi:hypothetical protein [Mumia sp. DW29H23]|uniref:hypothetical protein n=1 Tax=Mumia sp. DW29H23 TaxID=3421241 RepID=UPI003D686CB2